MSKMTGLGTVIGYAAASGTATYAMVAGVSRIQPPAGPTAKDIVVEPALDGDGHVEHLPGSDDTQPATFSLAYSQAALEELLALLRLTKSWLVRYPDGSGRTFTGYLLAARKSELSADAPVMISAEIVVQTKPAFVAALTAVGTEAGTARIVGRYADQPVYALNDKFVWLSPALSIWTISDEVGQEFDDLVDSWWELEGAFIGEFQPQGTAVGTITLA